MKKEIKELTECSTLEELFETWQAKQVEEVNKLSEAIHNSPEKICVSEIFIKEHYKKKGNTISSHFIQFFDKDNCKNCSENKDFLSEEETSWEYVLKNAFNLDGCVGTFDVGEGFEYIFLLKEANSPASFSTAVSNTRATCRSADQSWSTMPGRPMNIGASALMASAEKRSKSRST